MIEKLNNLLKKGAWDEAQEFVETNFDYIDVHTERNDSYSQDWKKTIKTSTRYFLFKNILAGCYETVGSYGSNERSTFEFDLIA